MMTLALVMAVTPTSPWQIRQENWDLWHSCIEAKAKLFSKVNDPADVVAESVVHACEPFLSGYVYYSDVSKAEFPGYTDKQIVETIEALRLHRLEEFEVERNQGLANARLFVIESRARNAPNP